MRLVASCVLALACATGCIITSDDDNRVGVGTVVLDWTIENSKDPALCSALDAPTFDVIVSYSDGSFYGEYQQDCEAFATSITLPASSYIADAVLLDSVGRDRTTSIPVRAFRIFGGDELTIPLDFPADSFF